MTGHDQLLDNGRTPGGAGSQLRAARERSGMTLSQVAQETRISRRHLENIERGDFEALPARTYAIGFAKTFAKVVGLDPADIGAMVSAEMAARQPEKRQRAPSFEPGDPARIPSARLGLLSVVAVILLLAGLFFAARLMFAPAAELPSLVEQQQAEQAAARAAAAGNEAGRGAGDTAPAGPVIFTALEDGVWVKFYDGDGAQLMQKMMAKGERYTVPTDVARPRLWTGRPDALAISIGGRDVARLAKEDTVMRDVPVTAEALLARMRPQAADGTDTPAT